jgi:hypothetical protein
MARAISSAVIGGTQKRPIELVAGTAEAAFVISIDFEKLKVRLKRGTQKPEAPR